MGIKEMTNDDDIVRVKLFFADEYINHLKSAYGTDDRSAVVRRLFELHGIPLTDVNKLTRAQIVPDTGEAFWGVEFGTLRVSRHRSVNNELGVHGVFAYTKVYMKDRKKVGAVVGGVFKVTDADDPQKPALSVAELNNIKEAVHNDSLNLPSYMTMRAHQRMVEEWNHRAARMWDIQRALPSLYPMFGNRIDDSRNVAKASMGSIDDLMPANYNSPQELAKRSALYNPRGYTQEEVVSMCGLHGSIPRALTYHEIEEMMQEAVTNMKPVPSYGGKLADNLVQARAGGGSAVPTGEVFNCRCVVAVDLAAAPSRQHTLTVPIGEPKLLARLAEAGIPVDVRKRGKLRVRFGRLSKTYDRRRGLVTYSWEQGDDRLDGSMYNRGVPDERIRDIMKRPMVEEVKSIISVDEAGRISVPLDKPMKYWVGNGGGNWDTEAHGWAAPGGGGGGHVAIDMNWAKLNALNEGWIQWLGGPRPVLYDTRVELCHGSDYNMYDFRTTAGTWLWGEPRLDNLGVPNGVITAYRIVK